eukprot:23150_3
MEIGVQDGPCLCTINQCAARSMYQPHLYGTCEQGIGTTESLYWYIYMSCYILLTKATYTRDNARKSPFEEKSNRQGRSTVVAFQRWSPLIHRHTQHRHAPT